MWAANYGAVAAAPPALARAVSADNAVAAAIEDSPTAVDDVAFALAFHAESAGEPSARSAPPTPASGGPGGAEAALLLLLAEPGATTDGEPIVVSGATGGVSDDSYSEAIDAAVSDSLAASVRLL